LLIEWNELLLTLGEIAIAITGFAGIVGVFSAGAGRDRHSAVFLQLRWMLDYSLLALFGALLPYLVFSFELSEPLGWRIVSGTTFAVASAYHLIQRTLLRDMASKLLKSPTGLAFAFGDLAIGVLILLNLSGFLFEPQALPHVVAVFYNIAGASFGFVLLVTMVWSNDET
jgi:hypothetical protein